MKKLIILIGTLVLALVSTLSFAAPKLRLDEGTKTCRIFTQASIWEGYTVYKNSCKSCHTRNNDKDAPFIHTESKTMNGWNRVFFKKYPLCATDGTWDTITQEQLLRVNDYLYQNALDSWNPRVDC